MAVKMRNPGFVPTDEYEYGYDPIDGPYNDPASAPPPAPPPPGENPSTGGGYLEGVGETIAEGSSMTAAQRDQYIADAKAGGVDQSWMDDFLSRNQNDYHRVLNEWNSRTQPGDGSSDDQRPGAGGGGNAGGYTGGGGGQGGGSGIGAQLESLFSSLLGNQGQLSDEQRAMRIERARRPVDTMRKAQTDTYRNSLANRGLLSVPGIAQGAEIGAAGRLEERLAPYYSDAAQGIAIDENQRDDSRFLAAMQGGLDLYGEQNRNTLGHRGLDIQSQLGNRGLDIEQQLGLGGLALGNLNANMSWNRFLAEFGLEREWIMNQIQTGRIEQLKPILDMFRDYVEQSRGGYR